MPPTIGATQKSQSWATAQSPTAQATGPEGREQAGPLPAPANDAGPAVQGAGRTGSASGPWILAEVDTQALWPVNHQLVDVGLVTVATDITGVVLANNFFLLRLRAASTGQCSSTGFFIYQGVGSLSADRRRLTFTGSTFEADCQHNVFRAALSR